MALATCPKGCKGLCLVDYLMDNLGSLFQKYFNHMF